MKKFLIFCVSIIVTVSLGFMVYYFTLNNEGISVDQTTYQLNIGDTVSFELSRINPKNDTKLTYTFENDGIVEFNEANSSFKAIGEGGTRLVITASNKDILPLYIDFYVGGGSKAFPFYIKNQAELARIGAAQDVFRLDSNYKLVNDISILGDTNWKAIGGNGANVPTESFTGTFDGQGHTVSNLKLSNDIYAGLFAKIGVNGAVNNLVLSNVTINGNCAYAGSIAGINNGTIKDCYVTSGSLTSSYTGSYIGGIVGANQSIASIANIYKCMTNVSITSINADTIGGIAGANIGAEINYCYTDLDTNITATQTTIAGGIVGRNTYSDTYSSAVAGCYVLGEFNGVNNNVHGGVVGVNDFDDATSVSEKTNKIFGNYYVYDGFAKGVGNYADVVNASQAPNAERGIYGVESKTYDELRRKETFVLLRDAKLDTVKKWDFENVWTISNASTPKFNKDGSYVSNFRGLLILPGKVYNLSQLMNLKSGDSVEIDQDINLGGIDWNPLNLANVTIRGKWLEEEQRYPSIYNFKIKNGNYVGFFGTLVNSLIENINFEQVSNVDSNFVTYNSLYMGVVAGQIDASTVLNNVTTLNQVASQNSNNLTANISSNYQDGTIYIGGLVGASNGVINSCVSNNVTINIDYLNGIKATSYIGGITGALQNSNAVRNSNVYSFNATVNGGMNGAVGGIVGILEDKTQISSCYIENSNIVTPISYDSSASGLVGHYEGGLAGYQNQNARIFRSATNNVNIQGFIVGGIVGSTRGYIIECYTRINLTGFKVGGVAGYQIYGNISDVRVDGTLANPVNDINFNTGDSSIFSHNAQKAGVCCISYGTEGNIPTFANVFVNCFFADDGKDAYITTCTLKDNKNYSAVKVIYSGEESNIVYNADTCKNARERGVGGSKFEIIDNILDFFQGATTISSYSTNNTDMQNGNYDVFTNHGYTVLAWSFVGKPTVQKCVNEYIQNS